MKFNPITKTLFTNEGILIKKLHCPYGVKWDDLSTQQETSNRYCNICEKNIIDTDNLSDNAVINIVKSNPEVCLKISMDNQNIRIINHEL